MSRTYRKTKRKQGAPKRSQRYFNSDALNMVDVPLPKPPRWRINRYEKREFTITVYEDSSPPTNPKDPRWVSKGTPHAIAETRWYSNSEHRWGGHPVDTGRYYLASPAETKTVTRRVRSYTPYWEQDDWLPGMPDKYWEHFDIVRHVRRDKVYDRRTRYSGYWKYQQKRARRREMKVTLSMMDLQYPDQLRCDMLNQEQEPFNWLLDDPYEHPEAWMYDDFEDHWNDLYDDVYEDNSDEYDDYADHPFDDWMADYLDEHW